LSIPAIKDLKFSSRNFNLDRDRLWSCHQEGLVKFAGELGKSRLNACQRGNRGDDGASHTSCESQIGTISNLV
jgi:hypothetical protein